VQALARVATLLPASWSLGLIAPARGERRALPRFEAVAAVGDGVALRPAERFDALFAARLAGYGSESERAFRTALRSCRLLGVLSAAGATQAASARLLGAVPTAGGLLQLYRGDLTDPLLRIDDYPTGVRPILADLSPLHDVLRCVDAAGLDFHLGIVPSLIEDRMEGFLRSLQRLLVSQHGFEHGYAKYSKRLIEAQDPFNQRGTVGGFDEFAEHSYDQIVTQLSEGRRLLEARTGHTALSYIPPTNRANRRTGRALKACGFEYVLSENPLGACALPCIGSDFYDRSSKFVAGSAPAVASLHATWEADLWRDGDRESLPRLLASLVAQRERARSLVAEASERVVSKFAHG